MPSTPSSTGSTQLRQLIAHSEQLLETARLLAHENSQLKARLGQSESRAASLEKRLAAARARVEALIAKLPDNDPGARGQTPPWFPDVT